MTYNKATSHTCCANNALEDLLNFGDTQDFEDAARGFVATLDAPAIANDTGGVAFDMSRYDFIDGMRPTPSTRAFGGRPNLTACRVCSPSNPASIRCAEPMSRI